MHASADDKGGGTLGLGSVTPAEHQITGYPDGSGQSETDTWHLRSAAVVVMTFVSVSRILGDRQQGMRYENKGQTSHEIEFFQGFSPGTEWG